MPTAPKSDSEAALCQALWVELLGVGGLCLDFPGGDFLHRLPTSGFFSDF